MKNIWLFVLICLLVSCNKDSASDSKGQTLDPNTYLYINLKGGISAKSVGVDSIRLKKAIKDAAHCYVYDIDKIYYFPIRTMGDQFKDTINLRFKFFGEDVIAPIWGGELGIGNLGKDYINIIFVSENKIENQDTSYWQIDTVAYVPNSIIKDVQKRIKIAFESKDIKECYRIFNDDYIAYPIDGPEYRKLITEGKEHPYIVGQVVESWYNDIYDDIHPKNSKWWQNWGVNDKNGQYWHQYWYGEYYTDENGNSPEWLQNE